MRALVDDRKNALVVPQRAVQEVQGKHQLVVVGKDDVAEIRAVTVGPKSGDFWVIDKGVEAGDRVVVEGLQKARNGTKVTPKPFVSSS